MSKSDNSWWEKMTPKGQAAYLAKHPRSKKVKAALEEKISKLSEDDQKKLRGQLKKLQDNPEIVLKQLDDLTEKSLSEEQKEEYDIHINEFKKLAGAAENKKLSDKQRSRAKVNAVKSIMKASGVLLAAAGIATVGLIAATSMNPSLGISTFMLLNQAKDIYPDLKNRGKDVVDNVRSMSSYVKNTLSTTIKDDESLGKSVI